MNIETIKGLKSIHYKKNLIKLNLSNNKFKKQYIIGILDLEEFYKIKILLCDYNNIVHFENIPTSLARINCEHNNIVSLDNLSDKSNLISLNCDYNYIVSLDNLPSNLVLLKCTNNRINLLDNLPHNLKELHCDNNNLISLDFL